MHLLSAKLAQMIESHSEHIVKRWIDEVGNDLTVSAFREKEMDLVKGRIANVILHLSEWISYDTTKDEIGRRYAAEGREYFRNEVPLCETIRAYILLKKTMWSFAFNESAIDSAYELYQMNELNERFIIFFDQAIYYITRGYMEEMNEKMKELWKIRDEDTEEVFFKRSFYSHKK
jgi:hypothetical protein